MNEARTMNAALKSTTYVSQTIIEVYENCAHGKKFCLKAVTSVLHVYLAIFLLDFYAHKALPLCPSDRKDDKAALATQTRLEILDSQTASRHDIGADICAC